MATSTETVEARSPSPDSVGRRPFFALAVAAGAMLMISFVATATNIAVPTLERSFNAPLSSVSWVVTSYNVGQVTLMLLGGRIADRRGRKQIFLLGMIVFAVGSALSAAAPGLWVLVAARVVQAVGAALVLPASLVAVLPSYPPERQASIVSLWSSMGVIGSTIGPTISALALSAAGWRSTFAIAIPLAVAAIVVGYRSLPDTERVAATGPLDITGATSGTLALGGLTIALVQGRVWGWTSGPVVAAAAAAGCASVIFVRSSLRHPEPLIDLRILRLRGFVVPAIASSLLSVGSGATWFLYPLFMRTEWKFSILRTGLAMSPGAFIMVFVTLSAERVARRVGYRLALGAGCTIAVGGLAWLAIFMRPGNPYWSAFVPATLLIGIGMGLTLGPMNARALRAVGPESLGAANGAFSTVRMLGSALGVALVAAVLGATRGTARTNAFSLAFVITAAIVAVAPILIFIGYQREPAAAAT